MLLLASLLLLAVLAVDGAPRVAGVSVTVFVPVVPAGAYIFAVVCISVMPLLWLPLLLLLALLVRLAFLILLAPLLWLVFLILLAPLLLWLAFLILLAPLLWLAFL